MSSILFDHVHLRSPDPEATARYYERMFGAELLRSTQDGKPRIDMKLGGTDIFIAPVQPTDSIGAAPSSPYLGLDHIGLKVSNLDSLAAELKSKGAVFTMEPKTIRPGVRISFVRGPEGVAIELLERTAA